jgi:FG-GAP-like repeat
MTRTSPSAPALTLVAAGGLIAAACGIGCRHRSPPRALALGLAVFEKTPGGRSVPGKATAGFLAYERGRWRHGTLRDAQSNVFHKLLEYCPEPERCGLLSLGGTAAALKLWRPDGSAELLWQADFGGRFSRLRDAEIADVVGDGVPTVVVGTHDQGVVALVRLAPSGYGVTELDRQPNTFVHEIEVGDLAGDGLLEVYAAVSQPNVLDGSVQRGSVVRYVPARHEGRRTVADLGDRHAKEILVADVDGDGRDELYVGVEAVSGGSVEVRRYDAGTPPAGGRCVAVLPDTMCRCLTAGDLDGDGRSEIVAALHKGGLWLLRPMSDGSWEKRLIADDSSGFEHAAVVTDLDGEGGDELYVASDDQDEVRRYVWREGVPRREVLYRYPGRMSGFTWNLTPVRASLIPATAWDR